MVTNTPTDEMPPVEQSPVDETTRASIVRTSIKPRGPSKRPPKNRRPPSWRRSMKRRDLRLRLWSCVSAGCRGGGLRVGGAAALAGVAGWRWLVTRSDEDGLSWPLRRALALNERLSQAVFSASRAAPEFPRTCGPRASRQRRDRP